MFAIGAFVLCISGASLVSGGWVEELTLGRGLDLGSGVSLRLNRITQENNNNNASLLERHALRLDFGGMGLSLGKALNKEALQIGLYMGDQVEGRKEKKIGDVLLPMLLGAKTTGLAALMLTGVTTLVVKALMVAKLAAIVSAGLIISKLFHHHETHVEEIHHPIEAQPIEYHSAPAGFNPSGGANYISYPNYGASFGAATMDGAETVGQYAVVEAPVGTQNITPVSPSKRQDVFRRKTSSPSSPMITVKKFTIEH